MSNGFHDDPTTPGRRIWRPSSLRAYMSMICAIFIGLVTLIIIGLAIVAMTARGPLDLKFELAAMMAALILFMGLLTQYVWRDGRGKSGGRITIDATSLRLDLPAGRSLIHRPPACHRTVQLGECASIETRLEGYGAQGAAMLQRPYRLSCRDGSSVFLFEQRGLTTLFVDSSLQAVAEEIATRAAIPIVELPKALGRGGILGVWFTRAPAWDAAPMTPSAERGLMVRVRLTGIIAGCAGILVVIAYLLS